VRALVTGGTGFVGSHVVRALLKEDVEVVALVRTTAKENLGEGVELIVGDLFDRSDVERAVERSQPDLCLHLAWNTEPGRYLQDRDENLRLLAGSIDLLRFLAQAGCQRVVVAGTCLEGTLSSPRRSRSIYAASKSSLHTVIEHLARTHLYVCAHLFYVFGPGEHPDRFVPTTVRKLLRGEPVAMTAGEQVRHYTYILDLAAALSLVALSDVRGTIDLCWGQPISVAEFTEMIGEATGRKGLFRYGELPYHPDEVMRAVGDPGKLEQQLAWKPPPSLKDRVDETVTWWREHEAAR
jgi:nucleoside-diphosphate-sugar epimerase